MKYAKIAVQIIELQNADLAMRNKLIRDGLLGKGYDEEMEKLHKHNADVLDRIIDEIGYPTIAKVGSDASNAAWLVIQHAISKPQFMKKCAKLLSALKDEDIAYHTNYAYLSDRIAVFECKPQLYGTSFDWNEKGELVPQPYDDLNMVNERRKAIQLNSLEEQTKIIRKQAIAENQHPPTDLAKRKKEINAWKKKVGWIR